MKNKIVYIAMATDIIHTGHMKIMEKGREYGDIIIGLLTDEAIARYKRVPILSYEERKKIFENIKGVTAVIPQTTLDYTENLNKIRPNYVIHGDDWKSGIQMKVRENVLKELKKWEGELIEIPYTENFKNLDLYSSYKEILNTPDYRRSLLRKMLKIKPYIRVIEASNGLMGLIAENTKVQDPEKMAIKEFDAMWLSSLCNSAIKGKPDIELVDITSRINTINEIMEVTTKPILFDGDTGGKAEHFVYNVKTLERLGISAVVIEDKKGLKKNSLFGNSVKHEIEDKEVFAAKIRMGKQAQITRDFMIFARLESLIAGFGVEDALDRARTYLNSGADGIMIHSKEKNGEGIFEFLKIFKREYNDIPVILVPTTYNQFTERELFKKGASIIIYANHLLRSAYPAMVKTAKSILENESSRLVSDDYCMPIDEIINLIPGGK